MKRFLQVSVLVFATTFACYAEEADLKHILSLLGSLKMGEDYLTIKKSLPAIGPLRDDAGENNTEALIQRKIENVTLTGEFNFSYGRLVSHGFRTGNITHTQAHDLFLRCATILIELYGDGERSVSLPSESDGAPEALGIDITWHRNGVMFGITLDYKTKTATINWGAQSESPQ